MIYSDTTWNLPWLWYTQTISKDDLTIKMIFIDTEILNKPSVIDNLPDANIYDYITEQREFLTKVYSW